MAEMFSGDWTVEEYGHSVDTHVPHYVSSVPHRFVIEGSDASDGGYGIGAGSVNQARSPIPVSGPKWSVRFEWLQRLDEWVPNNLAPVRRTAAYTIDNGLIVFLVSWNFDNLRDHPDILPYRDIVLRCHNLDPKLNPNPNFKNPYNFTLPPHERPNEPD